MVSWGRCLDVREEVHLLQEPRNRRPKSVASKLAFQRALSFDEDRLDAASGEQVAHDASGRTGTDDDHVDGLGGHRSSSVANR